MVFMEVEPLMAMGRSQENVIGQLLAECIVCDYANRQTGHWTPILAILCNGTRFQFFVLDSADEVVYSSGWMTGLMIDEQEGAETRLLYSIKEVTEYLFDYFVMGYINGLRSLSHHSTLGIPADLSARALTIAEGAHYLLRKANEHATKKKWEEAERTASAGVEQLKMSVSELSEHLPYNKGLRDCLEEDKDLEQILTERVSPSPVTWLIGH